MNLNEVLIKFGKGFPKSAYLELGTQSSERLIAIKDHFSSLYGVDEDPQNFTNVCRDVVKHKNITLLCGKSFRIPPNKYSVVVNNCSNLREGLESILVKNINPEPFLMVFLSPLTKSFIEDYFSGIVVDLVEGASVVAISQEYRLDLLERFKKEGI